MKMDCITDLLKDLMHRDDLTRIDVASLLGCSRRTVARLLDGGPVRGITKKAVEHLLVEKGMGPYSSTQKRLA